MTCLTVMLCNVHGHQPPAQLRTASQAKAKFLAVVWLSVSRAAAAKVNILQFVGNQMTVGVSHAHVWACPCVGMPMCRHAHVWACLCVNNSMCVCVCVPGPVTLQVCGCVHESAKGFVYVCVFVCFGVCVLLGMCMF